MTTTTSATPQRGHAGAQQQRTTADFGDVFTSLKTILEPFAAQGLRADTDSAQVYSLIGPRSPMFPQYKEGLFFGSVRRGKAYVSYHLMPLYVCPDLVDGISPALRQRMQGKSCFNFSSPAAVAAVADELASLTERSLAAYRTRGYI